MAITLTPGSATPLGTRRRTLSQRVELGATTLTFAVLALAVVISLIYLAHANRTATRGYVIKKLEVEKNALVTQKEIWQQQVNEAKSLATIEKSEVARGMQPVSDAVWVRPPATPKSK